MIKSKFFPWLDMAVFGGLFMFFWGGAIWALTSRPLAEWSTVEFTVLAVVVIAASIGCVWRIIGKLTSIPSELIITPFGSFLPASVFVWRSKGKPTIDELQNALNFFCRSIQTRYKLSMQDVTKAMEDLWIQFTDKPVLALGPNFKTIEAAGSYNGKVIKVVLNKPLVDTALFHELGHRIDECCLKNQPDYTNKSPIIFFTDEIQKEFRSTYKEIKP
jgi:hypothetical protein